MSLKIGNILYCTNLIDNNPTAYQQVFDWAELINTNLYILLGIDGFEEVERIYQDIYFYDSRHSDIEQQEKLAISLANTMVTDCIQTSNQTRLKSISVLKRKSLREVQDFCHNNSCALVIVNADTDASPLFRSFKEKLAQESGLSVLLLPPHEGKTE